MLNEAGDREDQLYPRSIWRGGRTRAELRATEEAQVKDPSTQLGGSHVY